MTTLMPDDEMLSEEAQHTLISRMLEGAIGHKNRTIPLLRANGLSYKRYHLLSNKLVFAFFSVTFHKLNIGNF